MRVSDLVGEGHECAVRVLLPVRGAAGRWHFWKDVVDSVEIDGEVYWEQICDRAPKLMDAPYGDLSDQTAAMLVRRDGMVNATSPSGRATGRTVP